MRETRITPLLALGPLMAMGSGCKKRKDSATAADEKREPLHLPPNLPLFTGHLGTARNATGRYVVDVVEFPEWCSRLWKICQG